jgi:hypothetical protein
MSAETVEFRGGQPPNHQSLPLLARAEHAVKLIRMVQSDLASGRPTGRKRQAAVLLKLAADELEKGIADRGAEARGELAEVFITALGPNLMAAELEGAKLTLALLLECLP